MKRSLLIGLAIVLQFTMFSQNNCNAFLKSQLVDRSMPTNFDVLVEGNISALMSQQDQLGVKVNYYSGNIASVRTNLNSISNLLQSKLIKYIEYRPAHPKTMNDTAMLKNRIKPVKQGMAPLSQAYDGTGVIVGIIDTGVDFNHPDLKDASGNTRIISIWDMNQNSGSTVPQPYNYGIEWTAAQINASVCTHNDNANYGHGTHVCGTAAGDGSATGKFEGGAPKADLIVVALNFNNSTNPIYSDAVSYIFNKATALGKPCVINASVGDYYGSHDATDVQSLLINNFLTAQNGRALVAASGNAGTNRYHVKTTLTNSDTLFSWFSENNATDLYYYIYADTSDIKNVQTSIGVNRASSFDLGRIPFHNYNYALTTQQVDTLKYNNQRIGIVKSDASINSSGVYEALYHIVVDSLNYLWRIESKGSGKHDAWDFNLKSTGLPTTTLYPRMSYYVMPDTISTIVSGFQCSNEVITVGNYINLNKWYDHTNTLQTSTEVPGKIKGSSSQGPTRRNLLKPDVVATGANVFSAMPLSLQTFMITNAPSAVAQGSMHIQGGGTSASSPVVAGLAALYLQAFPNASNQQVKQAISNCTYSDGFTGTLPNQVYGNGKLDGMAAMLCTIFTGVEKLNLNEGISAKPNPFHQKVEITLKKDSKGVLEIYDVNGKQILKQNIGDSFILDIDQINNYKGLLLIRVTTPTSNYSAKLISY